MCSSSSSLPHPHSYKFQSLELSGSSGPPCHLGSHFCCLRCQLFGIEWCFSLLCHRFCRFPILWTFFYLENLCPIWRWGGCLCWFSELLSGFHDLCYSLNEVSFLRSWYGRFGCYLLFFDWDLTLSGIQSVEWFLCFCPESGISLSHYCHSQSQELVSLYCLRGAQVSLSFFMSPIIF